MMVQVRDVWCPHIAAAIILVLGQTGLLAQEQPREPGQEPLPAFVSGQIDGESMQWVVKVEPPNPSAVFSTLLPEMHNFRISGYADDRFARKDSITIDFELRDGEVQDPKILYFPFAPLHPRFSFGDDHGNGELVIDSIRIESMAAHIEGHFSGQLFYHQSPNTAPIPHRTVDAEFEFSVVARRQ